MRARAKAVRIENLIRPFYDAPITGWFESENELYAIVEDTKGNVEKLNAFDFNFKFINI